MKNIIQLLAFATTLIASVSALAQGSGIVNFGNLGTTDDRRIWTADTPELVRAAGTAYQVALYWGRQGASEFELIQVGNPAGFFTGTAAGTFSGGNRTVTPLANNGDIVTLQVRGWKQIPGVANSYEAVLVAGLSGDSRAAIGKGPLFDYDSSRPGDPTDPPYPVGGSPGWRGFIIGIPEPSSFTLLAFGSAVLLLVRCRARGKSRHLG